MPNQSFGRATLRALVLAGAAPVTWPGGARAEINYVPDLLFPKAKVKLGG